MTVAPLVLFVSSNICLNLYQKCLINLSLTLCRRREREDSTRDRDRIKNALNLTGSEKSQLEKVRNELNEQIEMMQRRERETTVC